MDTVEQLRVYARSAYRITLQGSLDERWSDWLEGMSVVQIVGAQAQTVLEGKLAGQSMLVGLLGVLQGIELAVSSVKNMGRTLRAVDLKDKP